MLPKTLSILRFFGKVPLTGRDFVALCALNGITVKLTKDCERGFYYCIGGKHYIVLSTKRTAKERAFIGWHEFAHFLQNMTQRKTITAFSAVKPSWESERIADIFARIATRPDEIKITGPRDFIKQVMRTKI